MPDRHVVEHGDRYLAPSFRGVEVSRIVLDGQVTLHVGSGALVIDAPFDIDDGSTTLHVVPGDARQLHGAATLLRAVCRSVQVGRGGELRVEFADERVLTVSPSEERAAWQLIVNGRSTVVCTPGGELSFLG